MNNNTNQVMLTGELDLTQIGTPIVTADGQRGVFIPENHPCIWVGADKKNPGITKVKLDISLGNSPLDGQKFYIKTQVGKDNRKKFNLAGEALNNFQKIIGNIREVTLRPKNNAYQQPQPQMAQQPYAQQGFAPQPSFASHPQMPQPQMMPQQYPQPGYAPQPTYPQQAANPSRNGGYNRNFGGPDNDLPAEFC